MIYEATTFWKLWTEARPLLEQHAQDFAVGELDSYIGNLDEMMALETAGKLVILWAKDGDAIRGYIAWMLAQHQGLRLEVARMGPWFVEPEWRGHDVGPRLFEASLNELRLRQIRWAMPTIPLEKPETAPAWLRRLGAVVFEVTCLLEIK